MGSNGTLYVSAKDYNSLNTSLLAINPADGSLLHSRGGVAFNNGSCLATTPNGTVIYYAPVPSEIQGYSDDLSTLRFTYSTVGFSNDSSPAIGADGTMYFSLHAGGGTKVLVLAQDGAFKSEYISDLTLDQGALSANGILYFVGRCQNGTCGKLISFAAVPPSFSLRIDSVAPAAGRTSGSQQIKLVGAFASLSSVTIGGTSATWSYTNGASDTSMLTVTTPAHAVGAVSINLTPTSGSPYTKTNAFAYLPTVFTDDVLVAGATTARAQHIIELRNAVDSLRLVAGLGTAPWTDATLSPTSTVIKAVHITELRTNLEQAAMLLGYAAGSYTDPGLSSGLVIKRVHIEELRQRIRFIAG